MNMTARLKPKSRIKIVLQMAIVFFCVVAFSAYPDGAVHAQRPGSSAAPVPLLEKGHPVDWWFVFKFNSQSFPGCGDSSTRTCPFGGTVQTYQFGQQYVYASSENPSLQKGRGCAGGTTTDPLGATFDEVYSSPVYYVIWNDQ